MQVKWLGINGLAFKHTGGLFMVDPYVSRNRGKMHIPEECEKYLIDIPDFVLMTHAHWDHLADMPWLIARTGTVLYASKTACTIMRFFGVPEKNLHEISYGEELLLPGNVKVRVLENLHMGYDKEDTGYRDITDCAGRDMTKADNWPCGQVFAFQIHVENRLLLNLGSANILEKSLKGIHCNDFFCGISRWKTGFPEMLQQNVSWDTFYPTHHDEFTRPLEQFSIRDDMQRLANAIPGIQYQQLPILSWMKCYPPCNDSNEKNTNEHSLSML